MRISSLLVGLALGVGLGSALPAFAYHFDLVALDRRATTLELDGLAADAEELARRVSEEGGHGRGALRHRALGLAHRLGMLAERVRQAPGPERVEDVAAVRCMSERDFAALSQAFEAAAFASGRLAVLHQAARGNAFSVAQVATIMGWHMLDREKIEAAALLWPRVVDPEHAFTLYETLDFDSSRAELDRALAAAAGTPMEARRRHEGGPVSVLVPPRRW